MLILVFLSFIAVQASAETQVFFKPDQAVIVVQGKDSDAKNLYDSMIAAPKEESGILKKELVFSKMGEAYFSVACNSSVYSGAASCTIMVLSTSAVIDSQNKAILLGINDRYDASSVSKKFTHSGDAYRGYILETANGRLKIWKTFNSEGDVVSFTLQFRG